MRSTRPQPPPRPSTIRPHRDELRVDLVLPHPDLSNTNIDARRVTINPSKGTAKVSSPDIGTRDASLADDPDQAAFMFFTSTTDPWGAWATVLAAAPAVCGAGAAHRRAVRLLTGALDGKGSDTWIRELADAVFLDELGIDDNPLQSRVTSLAVRMAGTAPAGAADLVAGRAGLAVIPETMAALAGNEPDLDPAGRLRVVSKAMAGRHPDTHSFRVWSSLKAYARTPDRLFPPYQGTR